MTTRRSLPARGPGLHPAAWWLWAGFLAVAAFRTTNPLLLVLIAAVAAYVVSARRTSAPWSRSLTMFFRLGLIVIAVRVGVEILFGNRIPGHVIFTLPHVPLPAWAAGVSIGGPVTVESVIQAAIDGLRLAVVLVCFGAANSLASPYRLLRCLPTALYEAGVAITVALVFAPQVVITLARVRNTRRLRGRPTTGVAGLRGIAIPVLEGGLERSLELASSMDARGYGRRVAVPRRTRRIRTVATAVGLLLVIVGVYGALDPGSLPLGGIPLIVAGVLLLAFSLVAGGQRTNRTRYRPDVWRAREWGVVGSGAAALLGVIVASALGVAGLNAAIYPLRVPVLPVIPTIGIIVALLPAVLAPAPPKSPVSEPSPITLPHPAERPEGKLA